jgi:Retrotransposon gag protein/Zinc knuckle
MSDIDGGKKSSGRGGGGGSGGSSSSSSGGHGASTRSRAGGRGNHNTPIGKQETKLEAEVGSSHMKAAVEVAHSSSQMQPLSQMVTPIKLPVEDDRASNSAESDVHSSGSQQERSRSIRVAEIERRERELEKREQQLRNREQAGCSQQPSSASQLQSQQQQQQLQQPQPQLQLHTRSDAVRPLELAYATAGVALEDWLFKLKQLFAQLGKSELDWNGRAQLAQLYWDRHMDLWWSGRQEAAAAAGAPIQSWSSFVAALRKQFISTGDSEVARSELFKLRMKSGESMDTYMQRSVLLVARAGALMESRIAAALTLEGVDKSRFPFTCAAVARKQRAADSSSSGQAGMSFAQMRVELTEEALMEPQLSGRGSSNSSNSTHNNAKSGANNKQLRINALEQQLKAAREEEDDTDADDSRYNTAPVSTGSSLCRKCGADGHFAQDCKSKKELRACFRCGKSGHVRSKCPERNRGQQNNQRNEGEGAAAASSKPTPKNE